MEKLKITHLKKDFIGYHIRFSGDTYPFTKMCEMLKLKGWYSAHWVPECRWDDGKRGGWYVSESVLYSLDGFFFNFSSAMSAAKAKYQEKEKTHQQYTYSSSRVSFLVENSFIVLGLSISASRDDVKQKFRQLAVTHHPDKHMQSAEDVRKEHEEHFKIINNAYSVILAWMEKEYVNR